MFTHLRTKLTVLYVALFLAALGVIALTVYAATTRNVQHMVRDQLTVSGTVYDNLSATRYRRLEDEADVLAHDFGFRAAVATNDTATVRSALDNLGARFGVSRAFVVGMDGKVTAPNAGLDASLPAEAVQAIQSGDATSGVYVINGVAYETVAAPITTPAPAGWVVFASAIGPADMSSLAKLSAIPLKAEIFQRQPNGSLVQLASGKPAPASAPLQAFVSQSLSASSVQAGKLAGPNGGSIALARPLPAFDGAQQVVLLLRCPIADAFAPYASLVGTIAVIGAAGVLLLVLGSWLLARNLTRPISALEAAARQLQRGETARVVVETKDEIAQLGRVFNAMADDIQEREVSLKRARDVAEAANVAKSTFLANMNHEVRTPLNGVLGVAALLAQTPLDDHQRHMVDIIDESGASLLRILNDVLDMVELGAGDLTVAVEPFDLAAKINAMAEVTTAAALAKGLTFRLVTGASSPGWVAGDAKRFDQVLSNLLSNAVKFTDTGGVALHVSAGPDAWRFEVRDTGVGFDAGHLEEMFQPFSQADGSMTRRAGGTGLGLSLAREMARAMGGDITADGAPGKGSSFVLTLPLPSVAAPQDAQSTAISAMVPEPGSADAEVGEPAEVEALPLKVLVVDDHANNRAVIELILGSVGLGMVSVENGAEAVAAFKAQPFDVVLMDLQMPVMDGITAIRLIRDHERDMALERTPIVVVSANVQSEHLRASAAAGADSHLAKPILAPSLLAAIEAVLDGSGESDMAAAS